MLKYELDDLVSKYRLKLLGIDTFNPYEIAIEVSGVISDILGFKQVIDGLPQYGFQYVVVANPLH